MKTKSIGLLELGYRSGKDSMTALNDVVDYALHAERLGYSRFWLAEHHYSHIKNLAFSNPDIVIAMIAGMTEKIRVGSAGTSVPSYSPYAVATTYKLSNNLFNGRIDLGLSKGVPESRYTKDLLNPDMLTKGIGNVFKENAYTIHELLYSEIEKNEKEGILIPPYGGLIPELWYLSSSLGNAEDAIHLHSNYCISLFHNNGKFLEGLEDKREEINAYKNSFLQKNGFIPKLSLALAVNLSDFNELETKAEQEAESFKVLNLSFQELYELIAQLDNKLPIDEFILYDTESDSDKKIENAETISNYYNLQSFHHENATR
ncbi:LLM class flavin-dependent oxidoreductase [Chryseobacterium pennipullorum]|uniref:LLM class flavin-dependent oxidoreductase n=1 Tax=Chryseobacterium pennipullorum TaxID=2258963 RepID=A0A3D9AUY6_9FLAO|nr:LLM class flavin-dependent oxidoreductase [Chryseobacterium pennipullorum]REC44737.1 LLM class flavin-dependent oxidoreductase [Chryseobacterium pennipullorum]